MPQNVILVLALYHLVYVQCARGTFKSLLRAGVDAMGHDLEQMF